MCVWCREVKDKLSERCKEQVIRTQIDASKDFKVDAMLNELCTADAEVLCMGVSNKDGEMQECLRGKRAQLSWDCQEELFRQEVVWCLNCIFYFQWHPFLRCFRRNAIVVRWKMLTTYA